jgi:hypothetical protein
MVAGILRKELQTLWVGTKPTNQAGESAEVENQVILETSSTFVGAQEENELLLIESKQE